MLFRMLRKIWWELGKLQLGTPVVPFYPFYFGVSLLKLNSRKKGILIIGGLLGNLGSALSRASSPACRGGYLKHAR